MSRLFQSPAESNPVAALSGMEGSGTAGTHPEESRIATERSIAEGAGAAITFKNQHSLGLEANREPPTQQMKQVYAFTGTVPIIEKVRLAGIKVR
jgi:hypothetical protein